MLKKFTAEGRFEAGLDAVVAGKVWAFVPVMSGRVWGLGIAIANEAGYNPVPLNWAWADGRNEMQAHADELNKAEGLDDETVMRIVCSSMFPTRRRKA